MKKFLSLLLTLLLAASSCVFAVAEPYTGEEIVYEGCAMDLGITENPETPIYQAWKEMKGNVTINWSTAPSADYSTKWAMFLNTGDLPDLVWLPECDKIVANYGDMGYFLNLMDYLDYMPNLKADLEEYDYMQYRKSKDGKLYCLTNIVTADTISESFQVNMTELEALGLEVPNTWEEMLEAMRAFKAAKPDSVPFITYGWGESYYMNAFSSILNAHGGFYFDGEKWDYGLRREDSGYRELIEMMATMYQEGLIHPEFSTMSNEQAYQILQDGNWLFTFLYSGVIDSEVYSGSNRPYEYDVLLTPAYKEGDPRYNVITTPYDSVSSWGLFPKADVEHPEVLCGFLDKINSEKGSEMYFWGLEGLTFGVDENGVKYFLDDFATNTDHRKEVGLNQIMDLRYVLRMKGDVGYASKTEENKQRYDKLVGAMASGEVIGLRSLREKPRFTAEQQETVSANMTPINTYIDENIMLFIDGTRPMSEWDSFREEAMQYGDIEQVLAIYEAGEQIINSTERKYEVFR